LDASEDETEIFVTIQPFATFFYGNCPCLVLGVVVQRFQAVYNMFTIYTVNKGELHFFAPFALLP